MPVAAVSSPEHLDVADFAGHPLPHMQLLWRYRLFPLQGQLIHRPNREAVGFLRQRQQHMPYRRRRKMEHLPPAAIPFHRVLHEKALLRSADCRHIKPLLRRNFRRPSPLERGCIFAGRCRSRQDIRFSLRINPPLSMQCSVHLLESTEYCRESEWLVLRFGGGTGSL